MIHKIAGMKLLNELQTAENYECPFVCNKSNSVSQLKHMDIDKNDADMDIDSSLSNSIK